MKKIILLFGLCILFIGIVSAATYKQSEELNLKVPCINNNTFCSESSTCNITILNPNSSNLIYGQAMENSATYFNYTLTPSQTSIIGEYTTTVVCLDGSFNGHSIFTYNINPTGKAPSETAGSFAIATLIAFLTAAGIAFLIGHSFKQEDQQWYHLTLRAIFYMFSLGFAALGIGALNQLAIETDVSSSSGISTIINGGVSLITRMQYVFFIIIFVFAMLALIYKLLTKMGKINEKDSEEKPYNKY